MRAKSILIFLLFTFQSICLFAAQHDYEIANQSGLNFRTDINNVLGAIVSQNSGNSAPTTTFPYMLWVDTSGSDKILNIRNAANTAWVILGPVNKVNFGLASLSGATFTGAVTFSNTDYISLPSGTTAQRPGSPAAGMLRFNSDLSAFEGYKSGAWGALGGGGGGGGGANWQPSNGVGPIESNEYDEKVWLYQAGAGQKLVLWFKVPEGYSAGTQIKARLGFYSPAITNNFKIRLTATLIRSGLDAITSTTNQNIINTADILNATTANKLQVLNFDLTSSIGQINSVAISKNDMIKLELTRVAPIGTEDTSDIRFIPSSSEVLL